MTDIGELIPFDGNVYRAVLTHPGLSVAELAVTLDHTVAEHPASDHTAADHTASTGVLDEAARVGALDKAVARLTAMGLVRTVDDVRLIAVSPMLAEATVLGAEDLELGARRAAVEQRRDSLRQLIPTWNEALAEVVNESTVEVVNGQTAIANTLMHYAETCREELMSVAPGRMAATRIDGRTRVANMYSLRRGIQTKAIYQHIALGDRATRAYLNELAQNGARIRLTPSVPGRGLVVDREVALLPIPTGEPGGQELAIVRERAVVTWITATFEQLWSEASPLEDVINRHDDDTEIDETRAAILRLMAEGEKDEAISRRLSISVRTCRRHIADYMTQVGASSRFQAGVIAARAGHFDAPTAG